MLSVSYHQLFVISGAVFLSNSLIQDTSATTWPINVSGIPQWKTSTGCSVQCDSGTTECSLSCESWPVSKPSGKPSFCGRGEKLEYSSCCNTCQAYKVFYATRARGRTVYVLHKPWLGEWQLIPAGVCSNERLSSCRGRCVTKARAYPVKVADRPVRRSTDLTAARTWYEWLYLPVYCACESTVAARPPAHTKPTPTTTTTTPRPTRRRTPVRIRRPSPIRRRDDSSALA